MLTLLPAASCVHDLIALGEVMLRLDPGDGRVRTARQFTAWEGGGEYNVARGLRKCFGWRTGVVTALADNEIGRLLEDLMLQGGVDLRHLIWRAYDGVGRTTRNGINFTERGHGIRGALGVPDRANTAASQMRPGEVDWDRVLGPGGARWLHTGGIFAGLSESTAALTEEAMRAARRLGVVVSYDPNFRPSLWRERGGWAAFEALNHRLAPLADVCFGIDLAGQQPESVRRDPQGVAQLLESIQVRYPNLHIVAVTRRRVQHAGSNDWSATVRWGAETFQGSTYAALPILDRIGAGDGFAAGLIHGVLAGLPPQRSLELGLAHGALAMSTPGDTSMATLAEVERLADGRDAAVNR